MEFRILGGLEVLAAGARLRCGGPREQKVLAALLLHPDQCVSVDYLIEFLWDDSYPDTAGKQVRNVVSRLRAALAPGGDCGIAADGPGYRISLAGARFDAREFEAAVAHAQRSASAQRLEEAARILRDALGLWRGPALTGMPGRLAQAASAVWNERRLAAWEAYAGHALALGRHADLVAELTALVADHPLREGAVAQLMLALYRCGRQADALALYARSRGLLIRELGLEPGPALRTVHHQILNEDPAIGAPQTGTEPSRPARRATVQLPQPQPQPLPRQLPAATRYFTGREDSLKLLNALLDDEPAPGRTVVISAIRGAAGIGKTALAVHFAHSVASRFADGQLYLNLRGFDPSAAPLDPATAVRVLLDALSVAPARIPPDFDAQTALYRSVLADRRMLLLLDNACDETQVRPLLPGGSGCVTIVTSRHSLTGLVVGEGAEPITLDLFSERDARELLARRLGAERVDGQAAAVGELIEHCARLPLALSIVAARAALRPDLPLTEITDALRAAPDRLGPLDTGDEATDPRTVFSSSYRSLDAQTARVFRLLSLHPGSEASAESVASLAALPPALARDALDRLLRLHLIAQVRPGRFAFHDLIRAYAAERAEAECSELQRRDALSRVVEHYLHSAYNADRQLEPMRDPVFLAPPRAGVVPLEAEDYATAWAWFEEEHEVLLATVARAAEAELNAEAGQLAWAVATYLNRSGRWQDRASTQQVALDAARRLGDLPGQARAEHSLGYAWVWLRVPDEARAHLNLALDLYRDLADRSGQARTHVDLALVCEQQADFRAALRHAKQALELYAGDGHRPGQARALNSVGWYSAKLGRHEEALDACASALDLYVELGHLRGRADTLDSLGYIYHQLGRRTEFTGYFERALALFDQLGDRYHYAATLTNLGDAHWETGDPKSARETWRQARDILDDLNHPDADAVSAKLDRGLRPVACSAGARSRTPAEAGR